MATSWRVRNASVWQKLAGPQPAFPRLRDVLAPTAKSELVGGTQGGAGGAGLPTAGQPPVQPPAAATVAPGSKTKHFDTIVIGGGIVGVTTAHYLRGLGRRICLLEALEIGGGTTGLSTAKVSIDHNLKYSIISKLHGLETAGLYAQMNTVGLTELTKLVHECGIADACTFSQDRSHTTYTASESYVSKIRQEYDTCMSLGLPVTLLEGADATPVNELPRSLGIRAAVSFAGQAQFNSYAYCVALAQHHTPHADREAGSHGRP